MDDFVTVLIIKYVAREEGRLIGYVRPEERRLKSHHLNRFQIRRRVVQTRSGPRAIEGVLQLGHDVHQQLRGRVVALLKRSFQIAIELQAVCCLGNLRLQQIGNE